MDARFNKLEDGTWGVKIALGGDDAPKEGQEVTVTKRNGETQQVTLAEFVGVNQYRDFVFRTAMKNERSDIKEPGAFEYEGTTYIVKPNRAGTTMYAQKVVEISAHRINEKDEIVQIELEYAKGAMAFLREEHRLDAERAKELSIRYGRCIVCGRRLKAADSVERGIGPVCWGRVRQQVHA